MSGITSACAEKRRGSSACGTKYRNYLRMRGEEGTGRSGPGRLWELPPHARRRAWTRQSKAFLAGITSACAEKSIMTNPALPEHRNYLRMRGEETKPCGPDGCCEELPPHARRRAYRMDPGTISRGITSACAEKRLQAWPGLIQSWNYLRMRGEEFVLQPSPAFKAELPPHARRRGGAEANTGPNNGITSACAEKSAVESSSLPKARNYLRMRGEECPLPFH